MWEHTDKVTARVKGKIDRVREVGSERRAEPDLWKQIMFLLWIPYRGDMKRSKESRPKKSKREDGENRRGLKSTSVHFRRIILVSSEKKKRNIQISESMDTLNSKLLSFRIFISNFHLNSDIDHIIIKSCILFWTHLYPAWTLSP